MQVAECTCVVAMHLLTLLQVQGVELTLRWFFCIQLKVQVAKRPNLCGGMDLKIRLFTLPTAIGVSFGWKQWKRMDRYGTY